MNTILLRSTSLAQVGAIIQRGARASRFFSAHKMQGFFSPQLHVWGMGLFFVTDEIAKTLTQHKTMKKESLEKNQTKALVHFECT